ncbi:unnamed protein product, partial [marine sediment metagenome]
MEKYIKQAYPGLHSKNIHVVHCGINTGFFKPAERKKERKKITIISVGRFVEKKGFDRLIRVCAELKRAG